MPQLALGLPHKVNNRGETLRSVGARSARGTDFYLSAAKLALEHGLLLDGTLRLTRANQLGILGFGGDREDGYRPQLEGSTALLRSHNLAVGAEYRMEPDKLGFADDRDWFDLFVAWLPRKNAALTLSYVDLGGIATRRDRRGVYLSLQLGF